MRCSCRKCGTYMVQSEKGLKSGCKCPECGEICRDCMGSAQGPMSPEELKEAFLNLAIGSSSVEPKPGERPEDEPIDWRSLL